MDARSEANYVICGDNMLSIWDSIQISIVEGVLLGYTNFFQKREEDGHQTPAIDSHFQACLTPPAWWNITYVDVVLLLSPWSDVSATFRMLYPRHLQLDGSALLLGYTPPMRWTSSFLRTWWGSWSREWNWSSRGVRTSRSKLTRSSLDGQPLFLALFSSCYHVAM
jgi:hypothetical protein